MYVSPKFNSGSHIHPNNAERSLNVNVATGGPVGDGDSNPSHNLKRIGAVLTMSWIRRSAHRSTGVDGCDAMLDLASADTFNISFPIMCSIPLGFT